MSCKLRKTLKASQCLMLFLLMAGVASAIQSPPPNIVFILADDLGWSDLAGGQTTHGGGSDFYETPNIARLAREGMAFSSAYACANCAPTRAALISGQYPTRTRVYNVGNLNRRVGKPKLIGPEQRQDVAPEITTLAETLKSAGYVTAHVGKYHAGGHEGGAATLPLKQGFDFNYGGTAEGYPGDFFADRKPDGPWRFHANVSPELDAFAAPYDADYAAGYRIWNDPGYRLPASLRETPKHVGDAVADAALEFMEKHRSAGKPFFLQLNDYLVHTPLQGRPDLVEKFAVRKVSSPSRMGHDKHAAYAAMVAQLDMTVGRIIAYLEDPDGDGDRSDSLAGNTLVVFYSDNGGERGSTSNAPLRGAKGMFTEGGIRVPLIAWMPGRIPAGATNDSSVNMVDFHPTLADFAGAKLPDAARQPLDGVSLRPLLEGRTQTLAPRALYWHFPGYLDDRAEPTSMVLRDLDGKRWKLLYFYESRRWSLYNLTDDPGESVDVIAATTAGPQGKALAVLSDDLHQWLDRTGAIFPIELSTGKPVPPPSPAR